MDTILVANRGAIACRIFRTLRKMGLRSVAVYSEADSRSLHVSEADEAVLIGAAPAAQSYLDADKILGAAERTRARGIHPGYGFLSENADFAEAVQRAGIRFIGPTPDQIRRFGLKHTARALAAECDVPLLPGTGLVASIEEAQADAVRMGLPVMLKSTAGGGGIGLRICSDLSELAQAYESVQRLGSTHFKHAGVYVEKFVARARHIEVQIFGDGTGNVIALGERDCSAQRRNQKVIEETPAANLSSEVRRALADAAIRLLRAVKYRSAGTVEFLVDADTGRFYFLEVNTRLQVEHGVTEAVRGIDLVEWMVRLATGSLPALETLPTSSRGHAIEARLYAEDPYKNFQPSSGMLTEVLFPRGVRCDTWVEAGTEVSPFYDPLLAKVIVTGESRDEAVARLRTSLDETKLSGIETNLDYLRQVAATPELASGNVTTALLSTLKPRSRGIEVRAPGTQTTVQDYPGRLGYWAVGIPPSGPMDSLSFRLTNRVLGNADGAAGLEMTMTGSTLDFRADALIALGGAPMDALLDGKPVPFFKPVQVRAGQALTLGTIRGSGARTYLCVAGGLAVPDYLQSRSTFTLGCFGGHGGRALRVGDVLHFDEAQAMSKTAALPEDLTPKYEEDWDIGVLEGPHTSPEFFTEAFMRRFYEASWKVHYNSARTGVRLLGPKPEWARSDGGEAGLHPSNIHDCAYRVGAVDFTGDMPIILGPDGPSLGGFVCPVTVVKAELWKIGQLRPGNTVRFVPLRPETAAELERRQERAIATMRAEPEEPVDAARVSAVARDLVESPTRVRVVYRRSGDGAVLVEYGPMVLDVRLRLRVHLLMQWLEQRQLPGIGELTPGIRSLQVQYDARDISLEKLIGYLEEAETFLGALEHVRVPSRIVHLPLSWDDEATQLAIRKYVQSVRPDAPWAPSNIEFIRRINGLESIEDVRKIVFGASYLVLGLGDVYLGAPVATPVDPRHRLVTTKYNPARTWTPENAVGIGGAYLCIYGMEGPGGYQFVGRTVQVYNRFKQTRSFSDGKPWLLRFFDRIHFHPVDGKELLELREAFVAGRYDVAIENGSFNLDEYERELGGHAVEIAAFKARQERAFHEERERWIAGGLLQFSSEPDANLALDDSGEITIPAGARAVESHVAGSVWKIEVATGTRVQVGAPLVVVESMKMEITVEAPFSGTVVNVLCREGRPVNAGQALVLLRADRVVG